MYAYIKGILTEAEVGDVVIEAHGVGYQLSVPVSYLGKLPEIGSTLCLYTSFVVRELSQKLFGFFTKQERILFEQLITLSGIGPKTGLALIGYLPPDKFEAVICAKDAAALARVPGIGKRTAERLIVELASKIKRVHSMHAPSHANEAVLALIQLGLSESKAEIAIEKAMKKVADKENISELISIALKN